MVGPSVRYRAQGDTEPLARVPRREGWGSGRRTVCRDGGRVTITGDGPVLVPGPVEVALPDGRRVRSQRSVVALCVCRRSRRYPFCDTSHRARVRADSS